MFRPANSFASTSKVIILTTLLSLTLACISAAIALDNGEADPVTRKAVSACKEGKLQEAVELESQAIKEKPKDWLPRATISYFYWLQGNVIDAVTEGQKAVRYAPNNKLVLTNLGHMLQGVHSYPEAISLYEEARKVASDDCVPWLCLANCYFQSDRVEEGLAVLREMSSKSNGSFDWHLRLGEVYLKADKPGLAIEPLVKAVNLASNREQKSKSTTDLFVALLADNKIDRAKQLETQVLNDFHPADCESYVRAAAALVPASQPTSGKDLLQQAINNLPETKDSEGFFKLGRIFEDKAVKASPDSTERSAWLEAAATAFNQAIELNPRQGKYYLALAGTLSSKGKVLEMTDQLKKAESFDGFDQLISFLAAHVKEDKLRTRGTRLANEASSAGQPVPVSLTAVRFQINGLTCGCHVSRIELALGKINGVGLVSQSHLKPYEGTILIDQSVSSVNDLLSQCVDKAFEQIPEMKSGVKIEVLSQQPVDSIDQAVRIAQNARYGDVLQFPREFDIYQPVLPITLVADHSGSTI